MLTKRIQIYTNGVQIDPTLLTNMFQYYLKHGVTLNYDIQQVNVPFDSSLANSAMAGTVYVVQNVDLPTTDHDIVMFVYDLNKWKAPFWWLYPLWGNVPRDCTYMSNGKPIMTIGYLQSDMVNVQQRFIHEPMHCLAKIFGCTDQLDTYYLDSTPDAPNGNFAIQWNIFKPYLHMPPQTPTSPVTSTSVTNVVLTRLSDNGTETIGKLEANNNGATFTCSTLELPWKNNQHDISCIPKGTYRCSVQPFHNTHMYELSNTTPRTGIFVHPMNYYTDSLGCIGLGIKPYDINGDKQIDITTSVKTVQAFMNFMENKPFTLVIQGV